MTVYVPTPFKGAPKKALTDDVVMPGNNRSVATSWHRSLCTWKGFITVGRMTDLQSTSIEMPILASGDMLGEEKALF